MGKQSKTCNKSNAEVVKKAFFHARQRDCICHHTHRQHMHIYPQLLTLNKKHQMYTSIQLYILFALTDFQQLLFPMQMSRLSPTPNLGEVIWAVEYKWLSMIDRPFHLLPSTDRSPDRHMQTSRFFLAFLSVFLTPYSLVHSVTQLYT